MDYKFFSVSVIFVILGVVIMKRNKFYKYRTDDMLFAAGLKLFLSGFLFCFIGVSVIISELLKFFN